MAVIWQSAAETHRGNRRRANEDAVLDRPESRLWAVADGLGGHFGGRIASRAVVRALRFARLPEALADRVDAIDDLLQAMNARLRRRALVTGRDGIMGTTVTVLTVQGATAVVLWAGDTRLYRLRAGELELVTRDHSPLQDRLDGAEAPEDADDSHVVTRAVGCHSALHLDLAVLDVRPDDTFLLCSDGLYRELARDELAAALPAAQVECAATALLDRCLAGPARDNVSLVVVRARTPAAVTGQAGGQRAQ